jgi:O-antigen/teichoic acid export membrane protein
VSDQSKFSRDVVWNVGGLAVAGACGILLNYLVTVVYGAAALGVFNQVFAVYIVASQFAALGFHYSVLTHVAAAEDDRARRDILSTGLAVTLATGALFAGALWLLADPLGVLLDSEDVARGIQWVAPGVLCFALSKVTLACLNALQRMRWYAVLFGGRFVLMIGAFAGCAVADVPAADLPIILTLSEAVIFLISATLLLPLLGGVTAAARRTWARRHLAFGIKGFGSGMLTELNTRVDVLILGYFSTDTVVGAYSFAAILAEGIYQLLVVLRTNYAPVVIKLLAAGRTDELRATVARGRNRTYLGALAVGALAVGAYVVAVPLLTSDPALHDSWRYFAVLIAGMVASAGYVPFQPMLLYGGHPGWHTWLMAANVALNAAANVILIAVWGALGSALGTAIALALGVLLFRALVRWRLRLSL